MFEMEKKKKITVSFIFLPSLLRNVVKRVEK